MGRPTRHELEHKNHLRFRFNHVVQFCYVGVVDPFHDLDFSPNGLLPLNVFHLLFLVDFKSNFLVCLLAHAQEHERVSSLSDLFTDDVVIDVVVVTEYNHLLWLGRWWLFLDGFGLRGRGNLLLLFLSGWVRIDDL